jgi:hypothetical protein
MRISIIFAAAKIRSRQTKAEAGQGEKTPKEIGRQSFNLCTCKD